MYDWLDGRSDRYLPLNCLFSTFKIFEIHSVRKPEEINGVWNFHRAPNDKSR